MATKDDTPCVGSTSEDIVEEEEEFKNKSLRTDVTLKVEDILEEEFKHKSWRTDVTLKVEDRTFYVSKHVLGAVSPVFEAMFDDENKDEDLTAIPLSDKKSRDILEFLRCIYPNVLKPVTMDNVFSVLPLAAEYQVTNLEKTCETFLLKHLNKNVSTEQLCSILNIAYVYKMSSVLSKGEQIAITRPRVDFVKACIKVSLSGEITSKILNNMCINIETKYQKLLKENSTATVLCSCLGHVAKQTTLVERFLQGKITGKSFSFAIEYPYNKSFDIRYDSSTFSVCFESKSHHLGFSKYEKVIHTHIECCNLDRDTFECVCFVISNNRMSNHDDVTTKSKLCFKKSYPDNQKVKICTMTVEDEAKEWSYKGVCNFDVFLFINQ